MAPTVNGAYRGSYGPTRVMFPTKAFNEAQTSFERSLTKMKQEVPNTNDLVYALEGNARERAAALELLGAIVDVQPEIGQQLMPQVLTALDDPVQHVQLQALKILAKLGEHVAKVVEMLKDEGLRAAAAESLGDLEAWSYAEELRPCLADQDVEVVTAALKAAESWGEDGQVLASSIVACLEHSNAGVRRHAVLALTAAAEAHERWAGQVARLLGDADLQTQEAAVGFFAALGPRGLRRGGATARQLLGSCAAPAALALGHMKDLSAIPQIVGLLVPGDDAALALAAVGLQPRLRVEIRRPECAAAMALTLMGDDGHAHADAVAELLSEDLPAEAVASLIRSLANMGNHAKRHKGKLLGYLEHPQSSHREAACSATGLLQEEGVDALLSLFSDSHATVRRRAVEAVGELEDDVAALYVDHVAVLLEDPVPAVQATALKTLAKCGTESEAYAAIVCRMAVRHGESLVRQCALESLGRAEGLACDVAKCLEDRDPLVRASACKAMGLLGHDGQAYLMDLELLRSDPHKAVRKAADEAAIALGS